MSAGSTREKRRRRKRAGSASVTTTTKSASVLRFPVDRQSPGYRVQNPLGLVGWIGLLVLGARLGGGGGGDGGERERSFRGELRGMDGASPAMYTFTDMLALHADLSQLIHTDDLS